MIKNMTIDMHEIIQRAAVASKLNLRRWNNMGAAYETSTKGFWNPVLDGGDALYLATKLGMTVKVVKSADEEGYARTIVTSSEQGTEYRWTEMHEKWGCEHATNLAIVNVAAAMAAGWPITYVFPVTAQ